MNFTKVSVEMAPLCQAAHDLVKFTEGAKCGSGLEAQDMAVFKANVLYLPLKDAIEKGEGVRIFQLARMMAIELDKQPGLNSEKYKKLVTEAKNFEVKNPE